jgi:hypothetical protein
MSGGRSSETSSQASGGGLGAGVGSSAAHASAREYECVIYGFAPGGAAAAAATARLHALCDDACLRADKVSVVEQVFQRKGALGVDASKGLTPAGATAAAQELRLRRVLGDQILAGGRICASFAQPAAGVDGPASAVGGAASGGLSAGGAGAGAGPAAAGGAGAASFASAASAASAGGPAGEARPAGGEGQQQLTGVSGEERVELLSFGPFQRASVKKAETPVRSVVRLPASGDVATLLEQMGFRLRYETSHVGQRLLTREGVEVELFRATKAYRSNVFIVPKGYSAVHDSPLLMSIRAIAGSESEIDRASKKVRAFVDNLAESMIFQEVSPEAFLPRGSIR